MESGDKWGRGQFILGLGGTQWKTIFAGTASRSRQRPAHHGISQKDTAFAGAFAVEISLFCASNPSVPKPWCPRIRTKNVNFWDVWMLGRGCGDRNESTRSPQEPNLAAARRRRRVAVVLRRQMRRPMQRPPRPARSPAAAHLLDQTASETITPSIQQDSERATRWKPNQHENKTKKKKERKKDSRSITLTLLRRRRRRMASRGRRWRRRAARPRRARTAWGARALLLLLQQQEAKKARMQKIQLTAASANGTGPIKCSLGDEDSHYEFEVGRWAPPL